MASGGNDFNVFPDNQLNQISCSLTSIKANRSLVRSKLFRFYFPRQKLFPRSILLPPASGVVVPGLYTLATFCCWKDERPRLSDAALPQKRTVHQDVYGDRMYI